MLISAPVSQRALFIEVNLKQRPESLAIQSVHVTEKLCKVLIMR